MHWQSYPVVYPWYTESTINCPRVTCVACERGLCYNCRDVWHRGPCKESWDVATDGKVKQCPKCRSPIYKEEDGKCNTVRCVVCNVDFCWLCLKQLDGVDTITHYTSFSGCTMFGSRRWSAARRRLWRLSTPITVPLAIGALALSVPFLALSVPAVVASDDWKASRGKGVSKFRRWVALKMCSLLLSCSGIKLEGV